MSKGSYIGNDPNTILNAPAVFVRPDTGTVNHVVVANAVPIKANVTTSGIVRKVVIKNTNTGPVDYAEDGFAAEPMVGIGGLAFTGGELEANGIAEIESTVTPLLNGGAMCWVLKNCTAGAQQSAAGSYGVTPPANDNSTKFATTAWLYAAMTFIATAAGFSISIGQSGYVKFPSWLGGLIIQWGLSSTVASGSSILQNFPLAFPGNAFIVSATYENSGVATPTIGNPYQVGTITKTGFGMINGGAGAAQYSYIALGN